MILIVGYSDGGVDLPQQFIIFGDLAFGVLRLRGNGRSMHRVWRKDMPCSGADDNQQSRGSSPRGENGPGDDAASTHGLESFYRLRLTELARGLVEEINGGLK